MIVGQIYGIFATLAAIIFLIEEMERDEIKKQEALRQEKETLIKTLLKKKELAKSQREIEQLKKRIGETENGKRNKCSGYLE